MTRSERSVFDQWLEPDVRDKRTTGMPGPDVIEISRRAYRIQYLPLGQRRREKERIAQAFGVSTRTVDRYRFPTEVVRVAGWEAVYRALPDAPPRRLTVWTRADEKRATRKEHEE